MLGRLAAGEDEVEAGWPSGGVPRGASRRVWLVLLPPLVINLETVTLRPSKVNVLYSSQSRALIRLPDVVADSLNPTLQDDPTFKGLLASLRQAQDTPPPPPVEAPAPAAGSSTDAATPASDLASLGRGGYTVPYELPPPVDGVYPTYAELEQTRSGSTPTDPRDRSAAASDSPAPSTLSTPGLPASAQQPAHQDPFATTSGGGQKPKDLRLLTFTQALPYLTRLADDPSFLALIRQVRPALSLFLVCGHGARPGGRIADADL